MNLDMILCIPRLRLNLKVRITTNKANYKTNLYHYSKYHILYMLIYFYLY